MSLKINEILFYHNNDKMSNYAYREFSNSGTDKGDSCTVY